MWIVTANVQEQQRRSVYMFSRRTFKPAMFETFDAPDGIRTCSRREASNTAPQSLTLLNGSWTTAEAKRLGARLAENGSDEAAVKGVWRSILAREPDGTELARARAFLATQSSELGSLGAAVAELARALFNTNEFLYVD
jgi:hypothetical protein